jgi:hypothetical protein
MWFAYSTGPGEMHVIPQNDLVEHTHEEDCICGPKLNTLQDGAVVVMHVSLDGRERNEPDWRD